MTKLAKSASLFAIFALAILLIASASASAQTLSGTVTNSTTGKPAAGDEVILINISNGMDVAANTKADSTGKFRFTLKDGAQAPHLIRAVHQGVTYHQIAPPGTSNVDVQVYDVAKKVDGLSLTADVMFVQANSGQMGIERHFALNNSSSPPVTQMNDHNFGFYLPQGAKIEQVEATAPNGQPIPAEAVPQAEKGRYAINFPLRPGETEFRLIATFPYAGQLKFDPKPLYPAQHFIVVLPKSMHFAAADSSAFQSMQNPNQPDTVAEMAQQTHVGQQLGFTVSGTGTISDQQAQAGGAGQPGAEGQGGAMGGQAADNRPGGGLGAPIDAPDPLEKYRWWIIGGFVILLAIGGWIVTKRQGAVSAAPGTAGASAARATFASGPLAAPVTGPGAGKISGSASPSRTGVTASSAAPVAQPAAAPPKSALLLDALKEELFQLEVERKQGKISQADYEKAKAALDQSLDRALKRPG